MVILNSLEVTNFFSIEHETVSFEGCGFVVVVGPNGAGKTALTIEGPLYAIYGTSFEYGSRPGGSVCSHWAKTWEVVLKFTESGQPYRIERGSSGLRFFKDDVDISRGKSSDTQELIEKVIGRSEALFRRSVIFSVNMQRFPELPEADKKELFDELMGIGVLNSALKQTEAVVKTLEQEVDVLSRLAEQTSSQLARETALDAEHTNQVIPEVCESELVEERRLVSSAIRELKDRSEKEENSLQKRLNRIRSVKTSLTDEIAELTSRIRVAETEIAGIERRVAEQDNLIRSGSCPSCKQPTSRLEPLDFTSDLETRRWELREMLETRTEMASDLAIGKSKEQEANTALETSRKAFRANLPRLESELRDIQDKLSQLKASQTIRKSRQDSIDRLRDELAKHDADLAEKRGILEDEKLLKAVFGLKGCRVGILNGMLPLVNDELMAISEAANSPLSIQLAIKDQGESFAGNLAIKVVNPRGSSQYRGSSAGEKRLLDLFLVFALMSLADKRARTPFGHAFFDETLENLDDVRACAILALLKAISARKSSVILTAHRAETLTADQLWTVKEGKLTISS